MTTPAQPTVFPGGCAVDDRGTLRFVPQADFSHVKRFYLVENFSTNTIRAFHGHLREEKFFTVVSGAAIVAAVACPDPQKPDRAQSVHRYILSAAQPSLLYIPAGYANGFRALTGDTKLLAFSTATVEESRADDYRFPPDMWGADIWRVADR